MKTHSLRTSLRCLMHPATLFSIALLLLNDHQFKVMAPSWLTGKVSDLAGLFFFPFLLAAVLNVCLGLLRRLTPMTLGRIAFTITAAWFTVAKATPWGHALTVQAVSAMLRHQVSVMLDPTDLLGLVMLWPAWRLWGKEVIAADQTLRTYAGWLALALATVATVATSPPQIDIVRRVGVVDGKVYAITEDYYYHSERVYKTSDNGQSWSEFYPTHLQSLKDKIPRAWNEEVGLSEPYKGE